MAKQFYTEKDIEDLFKRGVTSLEVNDNVSLTDLAYEKANRLGMKLLRDKPENPPGAPTRPYVTQKQAQPAGAGKASAAVPPSAPVTSASELHQRIRAAVQAKLGGQVDAQLLDVIITRVLNNTGVK